MIYKLITEHDVLLGSRTIVIRDNGNGSFTSFVEDPANSDYQAYLKWLAEGNIPAQADESN